MAAVGSMYWCPQGLMPCGVLPGGAMPGGVLPGSVMPSGGMPSGVFPSGAMPGGVMHRCVMVPVVPPWKAPAGPVVSEAMPTSSPAPIPAPATVATSKKPCQSRASPLKVLRREAEESGEPQDKVMAKHAVEFSHDREGCLWIQQALDKASDDGDRLAIMDALRGHTWDVMRCPNANHVLQKVIVTVRPCDCQFVIDDVLQRGPEAPGRLARHKYAYRGLQRMLEHLQPCQVAPIVDLLVADGMALAMHRHGTFVMQHIFEYGSEQQQRRVIEHFASGPMPMVRNNDACMVLNAALADGDDRCREDLARAILANEGAVADMAHTRRGHVAVLTLLEVLSEPLLGEAFRQLSAQEVSLWKSRFGRSVIKAVRDQFGCTALASSAGA
uniref:PUM-HD domain-containing protein n=1 Tax=Zooxanthella nutricula TaxID=1333877 RepID=A0A7S2KB87_9DINO